mgnify:CR=1 FL=1
MLIYIATIIVAVALGWSGCLLWQSMSNRALYVEINNEQLFHCLKEKQ